MYVKERKNEKQNNNNNRNGFKKPSICVLGYGELRQTHSRTVWKWLQPGGFSVWSIPTPFPTLKFTQDINKVGPPPSREPCLPPAKFEYVSVWIIDDPAG